MRTSAHTNVVYSQFHSLSTKYFLKIQASYAISKYCVRYLGTNNTSTGKVIEMGVIRWILTIALIIVSVVLAVVVLMQEGKSQGLGAISGAAETYWGKNKGRSMEGRLVKITVVLCVLFFVLSLLLDMQLF